MKNTDTKSRMKLNNKSIALIIIAIVTGGILIALNYGDNSGNKKVNNIDSIDGTDSSLPAVAFATPDLTPESDSGISNSDNLTNLIPEFKLACSKAGNNITLFGDKPSEGTVLTRFTCLDSGFAKIDTAGRILEEGEHKISFSETNIEGKVIGTSPELTITIDNTKPAVPTVSKPAANEELLSEVLNTEVMCKSAGDRIVVSSNSVMNSPVSHTCVGEGAEQFKLSITTLGPVTLEYSVEDMAGNKSEAVSLDVTATVKVEENASDEDEKSNKDNYALYIIGGLVLLTGICLLVKLIRASATKES